MADDEEGFRAFVRDVLTRAGHQVVTVADGDAALAVLAAADSSGLDLVLTDLQMPGASGMDVVAAARSACPRAPVLVLTAFGEVSTAVEAMRRGAFDYLQKPLESPAALRAAVERALASVSPPVAAAAQPSEVDDGALSFGAPAMRPVVDAVTRLARTDATVLLTGETGTGKELTARAIHDRGARRHRPFVAVNCAVLADNLVESELFGHERGAFTGAVAQRRGRLELADKGTFFLDEVGELPLSTQAKLLRVIEERRFERLGGERAIAVDVRFIAATHRDLRAMIRAGTFRDDLYHRLAVFPLALPPLRARPEDIVPLAQRLLSRLASSSGRGTVSLTPAAQAHLAAGHFPGNVRELRNVLERALVLSDGALLEVEHLTLDEEAEAPAPRSRAVIESLEATERRQIERALLAVGGNRKEAASRLGIGLRTLYEKLKRYQIALARGVDWPGARCPPWAPWRPPSSDAGSPPFLLADTVGPPLAKPADRAPPRPAASSRAPVACYLLPMAQPLPVLLAEHLTKPRPLVFPTDATVPESTEHLDLRTALYLVLRRLFAATAWIGSDQFVYYDASDPTRVVAPDVFLRRGGPNEPFKSWKVWERGAPEVAIEIVSDSDAPQTEWDRKLSKYHAIGVVELARFDAQAATPLRVWDRVDGDLVERRVEGARATSRVLGLDLVVVDVTLRLERDGVILPTPDERAELEAARAASEAARAERLRAKLLAAGIDPDE